MQKLAITIMLVLLDNISLVAYHRWMKIVDSVRISVAPSL
jgi:hypothetical protein